MNNANFKYARDGYQRPVAQLTHVDLDLRIYDDRVEGHERLQLLPRPQFSKSSLMHKISKSARQNSSSKTDPHGR